MTKADPIQVLLCSDEGYIHQSFVVVMSALKNLEANREMTVHFVYCHDAEKSGAGAIAGYCKALSDEYSNVTFNVLEFDVLSMFHGESRLHISAATLARLVPTRWASGKVLYLDSDLVVIDDIAAVYDTDLDGKLMGVVRWFDLMFVPFVPKHKKNTPNFFLEAEKIMEGRNTEDYFNAGVLLLDLDLWESQGIDQALAARDYGQQLPLRDQDVLNQVARGNVKFLHCRWNSIKGTPFLAKAPSETPYRDEWEGACENPAIVHFAGRKKPWQYRNFNWFRPYYKWIKLYRVYWNDLVTLMERTGAGLKDKV